MNVPSVLFLKKRSHSKMSFHTTYTLWIHIHSQLMIKKSAYKCIQETPQKLNNHLFI